MSIVFSVIRVVRRHRLTLSSPYSLWVPLGDFIAQKIKHILKEIHADGIPSDQPVYLSPPPLVKRGKTNKKTKNEKTNKANVPALSESSRDSKNASSASNSNHLHHFRTSRITSIAPLSMIPYQVKACRFDQMCQSPSKKPIIITLIILTIL